MTDRRTYSGLERPRRLQEGDRLAAVTLSWGGPGQFPHRYEAGKRQPEEAFGVTVVDMPHTLADPSWVADHPEARVDDLHAALADPGIGCLEVLDWTRGTEWWPPLDGAVLAIETSEEAPSAEVVQRFLRSLAAVGDLERIAALLFGRPGGADLAPQDFGKYDDAIVRVVRHEIGSEHIPIVTGLDFGHTDPIWTLPQGVRTRVDPSSRRITFLESGVR